MSEVELQGLTAHYPGGTTIGPVSLTLGRGEMLSLLGPSGCGKTTVLRMLAGFVRPSAGTIHLRGVDVTHAPPHQRGAGLVFQNFALFPHLSVFDNIAFGLRRRRAGREAIARKVGRLIEQMRLGGLEHRKPDALSGGQQQRVAIGRALAIEPAIVLLDEPFSSLDAKLRESTRFELRSLQQELGFTAILVTHDQSEALSISDRIAIMQAGRLEQVGTPLEVYRRPASLFVATFVGRANVVAGGIVRPEAIELVAQDAPGAVRGVVRGAAFLGADSELAIETAHGTVHVSADGDAAERYAPGDAVGLRWPAEAVVQLGESG